MPAHRLLGLALAALLLAGCANPLPQRNEHEERSERQLISQSLQIEAGASPLRELQRQVRIVERQHFTVSDYAVTRRYDRYTPYQAWRELYEIPLGALVTVAGIGANLVNVLALGQLPESVTRGWIDYGLAGLNPALNIESNGRAEQSLASIDEQLREQREEQLERPWARQPVLLSLAGQQHELRSDRQGMLQLDLLTGPFAAHDGLLPGQLRLQVRDAASGMQAEARLEIERELRTRLQEAYPLIYDDLEDHEVADWVRRVQRLAELGFNQQAGELEQGLVELTAGDPQLQQEFLRALLKRGH